MNGSLIKYSFTGWPPSKERWGNTWWDKAGPSIFVCFLPSLSRAWSCHKWCPGGFQRLSKATAASVTGITMETGDSWELTVFLLQTIGLDPEFPHSVIVCLFDEALHLDLCGTGYFQILTGMKPEGFLGPLFLNDRGDFHWEDTHFAKFIPQRKHSECSPHCAVMDVCSDNSQDPMDVITGTQPGFFFPSESRFFQERHQG